MMPTIPGYDYGAARAARSPVTRDELRELEATVGWTSADDDAIAMAGEVLAGQEEAMVDAWRARIGNHPHLAKWFFGPDGKPDEAYKAMGLRHLYAAARPAVARLPGGDRAAPHARQEEQDRRRAHARNGAAAPSIGLRRPGNPRRQTASREEGPLRRRYRTHAPGLGDERVADLGAVEPSLRSRRSLVRVERRQADWVLPLDLNGSEREPRRVAVPSQRA